MKKAALAGGIFRFDHRIEDVLSLAGLAATYSSKS
jgi:hypothetical protein